MKNLMLFGAGGLGEVLADLAIRSGKYDRIRFLDDDPARQSCLGFPVLGKFCDVSRYHENWEFCVAVRDPETRRKITAQLEAAGQPLATLIHPTAVLGTGTVPEGGTCVLACAVISPGVKLGKSCLIGSAATIDQNSRIGSFSVLASGVRIGSGADLGEGCLLGLSSCVTDGVILAHGCTVLPGTVVANPISEPNTEIGTPAQHH